MMIAIPSWSIPLAITIVILVIAARSVPEGHGDYGNIGAGLVGAIYLAGGIIASLIVWIIYLVLK